MISSFEKILEENGKLVYTNVGTSMMPLLRQRRDLLIIAPKPEGRLKLWDVPLYKRDNGKYIMHRVLWVRKNDYLMCGDNQWRIETGITDKHIIGVLEGVNRDGKFLAVRPTPQTPNVPLKYRLYVAVWCLLFPIRCVLLFFIQGCQRAIWLHKQGRLAEKVRQKLGKKRITEK